MSLPTIIRQKAVLAECIDLDRITTTPYSRPESSILPHCGRNQPQRGLIIQYLTIRLREWWVIRHAFFALFLFPRLPSRRCLLFPALRIADAKPQNLATGIEYYLLRMGLEVLYQDAWCCLTAHDYSCRLKPSPEPFDMKLIHCPVLIAIRRSFLFHSTSWLLTDGLGGRSPCI